MITKIGFVKSTFKVNLWKNTNSTKKPTSEMLIYSIVQAVYSGYNSKTSPKTLLRGKLITIIQKGSKVT